MLAFTIINIQAKNTVMILDEKGQCLTKKYLYL